MSEDRPGFTFGGERVAVVGSRSWVNMAPVRAYVRGLPVGALLVSGGAVGVDRIAEDAARVRRLSRLILEPIPKGPNKAQYVEALFDRNCRIVEASDRVVIFWNGSPGSKHVLDFCIKTGKPYEVIKP